MLCYMTSSWDKIKFTEFLVKRKRLSARVAGDYVSRCYRIERELSIDLERETSSSKSYQKLLIDIAKYVDRTATSSTHGYSMSGTFRAAVKKFAEFKVGNKSKNYPTGHTFGKRFIVD